MMKTQMMNSLSIYSVNWKLLKQLMLAGLRKLAKLHDGVAGVFGSPGSPCAQ